MSQELQKTSERFPNEEAPECERGIIVTADEMNGTLELVEPSMVVGAVDKVAIQDVEPAVKEGDETAYGDPSRFKQKARQLEKRRQRDENANRDVPKHRESCSRGAGRMCDWKT